MREKTHTQGCLFGRIMNLVRNITEAATIDGKNFTHP